MNIHLLYNPTACRIFAVAFCLVTVLWTTDVRGQDAQPDRLVDVATNAETLLNPLDTLDTSLSDFLGEGNLAFGSDRPEGSSANSGGTWGSGNNTLDDLLGSDLNSILTGGDLDDLLTGGGLDDILNGDLDSILTGGGLDDILNGDLDSILNGGGLGDILNGDLDSILNGGGLGDILNGGGLGDILNGGGLGDILNRGDLGDILNGGGLGDILNGGGLGDILNGGGLGDILNGGGGLGDILGGGGLGGIFGGDGSGRVDIDLPGIGDTFESWKILAGTATNAVLGNLTEPLKSAPSLVIGALGVPDVLASQEMLRLSVLAHATGGSPTVASQRADRFNINPHSLADTLGKEVARAASVGFSHSLLSQSGQQAIEAEVQAADETLSGIVATAEAAQELDVTQDVMKNLAAMEAQRASLEVASYGQTIQLRQQIAADALVQAEAAEELASLNRRENAAEMAGAAEVIQASSTLLLF